MSGFKGIIISIISIMICIIFMFGFIINYLNVVNPASPILDSKYELNSSMSVIETRLLSIKSTTDRLSQDLPSATVNPVEYMFLISKAFFTIPLEAFKMLLDSVIIIPTIVFKYLRAVGWSSPIVLGVSMVGVSLVITIIILAIKIIRTGEGER